jgi:hypothetical protein
MVVIKQRAVDVKDNYISCSTLLDALCIHTRYTKLKLIWTEKTKTTSTISSEKVAQTTK